MIGERLKLLRKEKGFEAQFIAKQLNVSKSTYSYYENDKSDPSFETLKKLADIFDVSTDYLLGRTDIKEMVIVEGNEIPNELRVVGINYMEVDKTAKEEGFTPEDIKEILETIGRIYRKNNNK